MQAPRKRSPRKLLRTMESDQAGEKKVKTVDGEGINNIKDVNDDTVSLDESIGKTQKGNKLKKATSPERSKKNGAKGKTATTNTSNGEVSSPKKKQSSKVTKTPVKKKTKAGLPVSNIEENENVQHADAIKSKDSLEKTTSDQDQPRSKKSRKKSAKQNVQNNVRDIDKINAEVKEKSLDTKQNIAKAKTTAKSRNSGIQKQNDKDLIEGDGHVEEEKSLNDLKKSSSKVNKTGHGKPTKTRGKSAKTVNFSSGSSCELNTEKDTISLGSRKRPNNNTGTNSLSEKKINVFDHLFCELKKCPGFSKVTVSSAAEILLKLTADKLKTLVHGLPSKRAKTSATSSKPTGDNTLSSPAKSKASVTVSEPKRRRTSSEKSPSLSSSSPEKTGSGKSEQVKLSQAAEALVSFRTNPTILRQEKTDADVPSAKPSDKGIANTDVNAEKNSTPKESCTVDNIVETPMQTTTTANEGRVCEDANSCYVNALSQSQAASQPQSSLVVQGLLQPPVRFPASIEANLQQVANVQHNLMNLSQFTAQLNSAAASVTPQISPRLTAPSSLNPSSSAIMSSRMMNPADVQNLQALFCRPTQPSSIQTPLAVQGAAPSLSPNSNNPQAQPQQPLKGMEDVVSCVGSRATANLLWNIKPAAPVVYLTSPQTLSGVRARNFIPQSEGHGTLPFTAGMASVQSVGIPKASLNSASTSVLTLGKVTLVSQPAALSTTTSHAMNMSSQRPILPRDQRMAPMFPGGSQSASQLPVTTIMGQIPRNIPPVVRPGSMPVQFSNVGTTSPLNTRQTPITVVTQVPCVTTVQSTTTVSTAAGVVPVSAKQAVKKFVHERTKSAELRRTSSLNNLLSSEPIAATSAVDTRLESAVPNPSSQSQASQPMEQAEKQSAAKQSEFNLHQAASALLSISSQDGLDAADTLQAGGEGEDSLDEHDDEVVFTSKGVFRVGDVDVDPKYNSIGREGYTCGKCGKIFTSLSYLARHIKRVCPDMSCRKWKCTMCDKAFRHPFGLQQHIYTHTGERPHKCPQCPKAFYSSNDLRRHSRIHSGERPYHCKHCEKSFATTISLKTHTYIHTGEKPHKCPHCPKTFATSSKLGRHIVTHSEQRPFTCDHCPKSFNRSGDLRRHNMHVHEALKDKPIDFEDSSSTQFNINNNESKEQDRVRGQQHRCSECEEVCDSSAELGRHMLHHDPLMKSNYGGSALNHITSKKPSQDTELLDESTESASADSN
ncbi:uncharacterized protein LOC144642573 isoform X2 [Oculina patagonica]